MNRLAAVPTGQRIERIIASTGRHLGDYVSSGQANHPHFSSLRPLGHDGILTNHAPWDHPWHHGLWWAWKFIDDVLFWEDREGFGGDRRGRGTSVVVAHHTARDGDAIVISQELAWRELTTGDPLLRERRQLLISEDPDSRSWSIDWDHRWDVRRPVVLGTTPFPEYPWGGYAGLNYRPARSMVAAERIRASRDRQGVEAIHGHPVDWVSLTGNVDDAGDGDPDRPASGGIILAHHPRNDWGERSAYAVSASANSFGFIALAPLMHADRVLHPGERLRLRYRTTVLGEAVGIADATELAGRFGDGE